jgi:quinol monooxygenase YgiN
MTPPFGLHGKITATVGNGDALADLLLEAAAGLESVPGCLLYMVSRDPSHAEAVWVTEAWVDREAHAAALQLDSVREQITRAMPIIARPPEGTELRPVGGKGVDLR